MTTEIDCAGTGVIALGQDELVIIRAGGPWLIGIATSLIAGTILEILGSWDDFMDGIHEGFDWAQLQEGG